MAHEMHDVFGKIPIERTRFLLFQSAGTGKLAHRKHTIHDVAPPVSTRRRHDGLQSTSVFEALRDGWQALLLLAIALCSLVPVAAAIPHSRISPSKRLTTRAPTLNGSLLEVLEVAPPVESVTDAACQETLMVYSFANSYGQPFVGECCHKSAKPTRSPCNLPQNQLSTPTLLSEKQSFLQKETRPFLATFVHCRRSLASPWC